MGWAPPPTQKPGKFDFLAPMLENYFKGKEQFNQRQDFRNIQAPGFDLGGLQSNAYQRAMGQQALQNRMPPNAYQQSQIDANKALAEQRRRPPAPTKGVMQRVTDPNDPTKEVLALINPETTEIMKRYDIVPKKETVHEKIAQKNLDRINELEAKKAAGTITKAESVALDLRTGGQGTGFSRGKVNMGRGALTTGAPSSVLGVPLETLDTRKDHEDYAINEFGPDFRELIPELAEIIDEKFPNKSPMPKKVFEDKVSELKKTDMKAAQEYYNKNVDRVDWTK